MRKQKNREISIEIVSTFFILLFVYTASNKLAEPEKFIVTLSKMPFTKLLPTVFSYVIPIAELIVACLLFFPATRQQGLLLSSILMLLFTSFIAFMLLTQDRLPCSCGGVINLMGWKTHLAFNTVCVLLSFRGWQMSKCNTANLIINSTFYSNKRAEPKT